MRTRLDRVVRRSLRLVVLVACAALLSGCWPQIGADGGHTRNNAVETTLTPANVNGLHQVWSATVSRGHQRAADLARVGRT